jgi:hypothetical protein
VDHSPKGRHPLPLVFSVIALSLGIVAVLLAALAFSQSSLPASSSPPSGSRQNHHLPPTPATRTQWAAEGNRLVDAEKSSGSSEGVFAYQSLPVNITGNGMYRLDYGPIPSDFGAPKPFHPFGVVFDFPPWARFDIFIGANSSVVSLNGAWYYEVEAKVSGFIGPYPEFTGWIYS